MIRAFFVALALALGIDAGPGPAPPERTPTPLPRSVLAVFQEPVGPGSELARVDPLTLRQSGRSVRLANGSAWTTALSPDRKTLAVSGGLGTATVELVDLRRMRSRGFVDLVLNGGLTFLSWERGLFAVVDDYDRRAVVQIDPKTLKVQARHVLDGTILQVKNGVRGQVVLLLAPRTGIGQLRLAVVGGKGMTETSVPGLTGGATTDSDGEDIRTRELIPALVVDEAGRRAFVYAKRTVVEISLNDLSATTHTLSEPVSVLGRFRNWLEPAAQAKIVEGYYRSGSWLGDGLFAVTGMDFAEHEGTAAGLSIIDTEAWTVRVVADGGTELAVSGNDLLTFGYHENEGVRGYDLHGEPRFHVLRGQGAWVQLVRGLAYAQIGDGRRIAIIDPATGTKIGQADVDRPVMLINDPPKPLG
jgi:hypothetical protein